MKTRSFGYRLRCALHGLREGLALEASFRIQLLAALFAIATLLWLRPPLVWVALIVVLIGSVLAAELVNTALERALDGLHPGEAEVVRLSKDCAAGAVLVLSATAVVVFVVMLVAVV
jgi:diacylglycerol kinase (ATP)